MGAKPSPHPVGTVIELGKLSAEHGQLLSSWPRQRVVIARVDLPALIRARRSRPGNTLRDMEERARQAGHQISRSAISDYERGNIVTRPTRERVVALAAALGCTYEEVATAVQETYRLEAESPPERQRSQRAEAWLRLTGDRTDDEVTELLLIVEQILRMRDMDGP